MSNKVTYVFTIRDKFSAKLKKITRSTEKVRQKMKALGRTSDKVGAKVSKSFALMGAGARKAAAGGVAKLAAGFLGISAAIKIITAGADFEESMADLASITGITGKKLDVLREAALRFSRDTATPAAEIALMMKQVGSKMSELVDKTTVDGLLAVTKGVLALKNATGGTFEESVTGVVGVMNQFQKKPEEAMNVVNMMAQASKIGASEVGQTLLALRAVGPAATMFGVPLEEILAAIQLLARHELFGGRGGTGLKGTLLKLNKKLVSEGFEGGIGGQGGFISAMKMVSRAKLTPGQMERIFMEESVQHAVVLTSDMPIWEDFKRRIPGTEEARRQKAVRFATVSKIYEQLSVSLQEGAARLFGSAGSQGLMRGIGTSLVGAVQGNIDAAVAFDPGSLMPHNALPAGSDIDMKKVFESSYFRHDVQITIKDKGDNVESIRHLKGNTPSGLNVGVGMEN